MWQGQRQTLAWMRELEAETHNWSEWGLEDINLPALDLNLQVEASFRVSVRGGVIADEVGAGKTTTSLALIARGMEDYVASTTALAETNSSGYVPSQATLILVPANLIPQWKSEIIECFGDTATGKVNLKLVLISEASDILRLTVDQIKNADIILAPWNSFEKDTYWSIMRELCLITNIPGVPGRAFQQWLDNAMADLQDLAKNSNGCTNKRKFWEHRRSCANKKRATYSKFHAFRQLEEQDRKARDAKLAEDQHPNRVIQASFPVSAEDVINLLPDNDFDRLLKMAEQKIIPLLHFFEFERLIVDEFTYLEGRSLLAILKLEAKHRWMLSGTPPLNTYDSVNTIAKLLGTKITTENEKNGVFSFARTKISTKNEKSYAEEFREQSQMPSPSWIRKRNEKAEEFVMKFVHKRGAPPAVVKQITHYIGVDMSVAESIIVLKAFHRLMRQTIKFRASKRLPTKEKDVDLFLEALEQAPNAEAALLCSPAQLLDDLVHQRSDVTSKEICREMIEEQMQAIEDLLVDMNVALREAFYLWNVKDVSATKSKASLHAPTDLPQFGTFLNGVYDSNYGDSSVQNIVMNLVMVAEKSTTKPINFYVGSKGSRNVAGGRTDMPVFDPSITSNLSDLQKELKERAADLDEIVRSLTEHVQQARLLRAINQVIHDDDDEQEIQCSGCKKLIPISSLKILGLCGHFSCDSCLKDCPALEINPIGCVTAGCTAPARDSSIPAKIFASTESEIIPEYGTKALAVVNKIKEIQASTPDERVLLFVQFEAIHRQLLVALESHGVEVSDACKDAEKVINRLKADRNASKSPPSVLLLKVDSPDAAGWNLQEYNHVMFVSPLLVRTKADYKATMTQAVGRAFRYGQNKNVHVYHFVWCHTAEVNILQRMEGRRFVCRDGTYDLVGWKEGKGCEDLCGPSLAMVKSINAGEDDEEEDEDDDE